MQFIIRISIFTYITLSCNSQLVKRGEICLPTYVISHELVTRPQAHIRCRQQGLYLANFANALEFEKVYNDLCSYGQLGAYYWVDGIRYFGKDNPKWWYDSEGRNMTVTKWCTDRGQPEEANGNAHYKQPCVALDFRKDTVCAHDYPCFVKFPFICSKHCELQSNDVHAGEFCAYDNDRKTADEAERACQEKSSDNTLLVLGTSYKAARLAAFRRRFSLGSIFEYWTSLKRLDNRWIWNSTRGKELLWGRWKSGQDNTNDENCAIITSKFMDTFFFEAKQCTDRFAYICE